MSERERNLLLCILSLALGGICYVLFRPDTYIAHCFDRIPVIPSLRKLAMCCACEFVRFYLPDFLWGLSFGMGLLTIFEPETKGTYFCVATSFVFGGTWELLQYFSILPGTGDYIDILMYLWANLLCIILSRKVRKAT